ncbi:MAG TPA: ribonuclease HII [Arcobacter sp.]|nr:ribonuclease HII [Arcobacter sp.]HIP55779.1 ribonuclease HII [Arcobacter sp.]
MNILCGIDEAGRGPLAGPMTVAGVVIKKPIDGLNDSKKLSEKKRESLFDIIKENCSYHIVTTTNKQIDELGLSLCISNSIKNIMSNIKATSYLMDGNTTFGIEGLDCLIKADQSVQEVSAASILAKVTRDRYMKDIAKEYPLYSFEKHKGYGTKAHIEAIKIHGFSELHRVSYKIKGVNS